MQLKTIIFTDGSFRQSSMQKEIAEIMPAVRRAKNFNVLVPKIETFKVEDSVPTRIDSDGDVKTTWEWFEEKFSRQAFARGYNVVIMHIGGKTKVLWGIDGVNGYYRTDPNAVMEAVVIADRGQRSRTRSPHLTQLQRVLLHEWSHGFERWLFGTTLSRYYKRPDGKGYYNLTHYYDYVHANIEDVFELYDASMYRGNYDHVKKYTTIIYTLQTIIQLYGLIDERMIYPVLRKYWDSVSQSFGKAVTYTRSGIHNGSDHRTPVGTKINAWARNFEILEVFHLHESMGNACEVRFKDYQGVEYYARILHAKSPFRVGSYKKGDTIGLTGNTGLSTGPHLHIEIWKVPIDLRLLGSKQSALEHLEDPVEFFDWHINRVK